MPKLFLKLIICLGVILFCCELSQAQQVVKMSDKMRIELSLDLIRKGIQQEDTLKVSSVFANQFATKEKTANNKDELNQKLQTIFNNSSQRNLLFARSRVSKAASGNSTSHLWDFDILSPKIEIRDDSAFVDCELVLWGANSNNRMHNGAIIQEQFVFFSPPMVKPEQTDEGYQEWGSILPKRLQSPKRAGWVLVKCDNFFEFLENYGEISVEIDNSSGVEK